MNENKLLARWRRDVESGSLGVQLVDVDHPLEIYVGTSDLGAPRLQLRSELKPNRPALSDVVIVDLQQSVNRWVLTLTLYDLRFTEVFLRLGAHVVTRSSHAGSESQAWASVDAVFDEWRRVMKPRSSGLLSLDALRGLVGEMWFLSRKIMPSTPADAAVLGWLGPLGSPQDFWYADSGATEVKSVGPTARSVRISSADQLDVDPMTLVVLEAPQVAADDSGSTSLVSLIGEVAKGLDALALPHDEVELRINRLGVDVAHPYYRETHFSINQVQTYRVDLSFPAVRATALPAGVNGVTYAVDRAVMADHLLTTETLG